MTGAALSPAEREREAQRQQMLLQVLWRDEPPGALSGWMPRGDAFVRGLQAYQAHAGALAERALAAAYPTVMQLLGDESFAGLARAFWHQHAPLRGDVACWGAELPGFIRAAGPLADEAYLPDVAHLDWAVHCAHTAADGAAAPQGLELLAQADPAALWLHLQPGTALVASAHPVVAIWQAHHVLPDAGIDRFAHVRQALQDHHAEAALVHRQGFVVRVRAVPAADLRFTQALLQGLPIATALATALDAPKPSGADFNFETWLIAALQGGWLAAASLLPPPTHKDE